MRAYKKRGKNILRFYLALALLLSLIVFFFGDKILLVPIWAVLFLFYTLTITPPPEVENKITKFGIESAGITLRWELLSHFYFIKRFDFDVAVLVTHAPYYLHTYLVVPSEETKKLVMNILSEHLIYQEVPNHSITDRLIEWFSHLLPDDEVETQKPVVPSPSPQTPVPSA